MSALSSILLQFWRWSPSANLMTKSAVLHNLDCLAVVA